MIVETLNNIAKPDRFATSDEVRAALSCLCDVLVESAEDTLWEVPSDLGGHVLVDRCLQSDYIRRELLQI